MLLKNFELKGKQNNLQIGARSDNPRNLSGIIIQDPERNIAFTFPEILKTKEKYRATCQDCFTRQFAPWSCSFIKTGD